MQELPLEPEVAGGAVDRVAARSGSSIASRWTRIWCVRPVSSRSSSSARGPSSSTTSKCVTASRGVAVSSEWRVLSSRSRPIGASIRPVRERGAALHEREVAPLDGAAPDQLLQPRVRLVRAGDDEQARGVAVEPVDDPRPVLVAAGGVVARAGRARASRVWWPVPGWTTTPAGLSTTSRCSSSQTTSRSISSASSGPASAGSSTTTSSPPSSRWLFARGSPSTRTAPSAISRSASDREPTSDRAGDGPVEPLRLRGEKAESGQRCSAAGAWSGRRPRARRRGSRRRRR